MFRARLSDPSRAALRVATAAPVHPVVLPEGLASQVVNRSAAALVSLPAGCVPARTASWGVAVMLGSAAVVWGAPAVAQDDDYGNRPSIQLGDSDFYPSLRIGYERNDNAFLTPDNETDATDVLVSPEVVWRADQRALAVEGRYQGDFRLSSEDALDRTDHLLGLTADAELGVRQRVSAGLSFQQGSEDVGTELTRGNGEDFDEPAVFNELNAEGQYIYGADGARGNLAVGLRLQDFDYEPLRRLSDNVDITDGRAYTLIEPFGTFSLRLSQDTRALLGVELSQFDYDDDSRDRQDLTAFTGLNFSATGALTGDLQLGATTASFDNINRDDQTTFTARVRVTYLPVDFSRLTLTFNREFDNRTSEGFVDAVTGELNTQGDVLTVEDLLRLDWNYNWSSRLSHQAFFQFTNRDRECPDIDDDVISAGVELNLLARRWLEVGVGYRQAERAGSDNNCGLASDAEAEGLDYDRQVISAHVRFTL